jgi:nucleotide-binding universal stress UspA family protein
MTSIVVGLDGSDPGRKALEHAKELARLIGDCDLVLAFVIEWTPYSFHSAAELEQRHKRREEEIGQARDFFLSGPAKAAEAEGFRVATVVRHGDAGLQLDAIARDHGAHQIVIGRTGAIGLRERLFGGVAGKLVATATVPVTIIP